MPTTDHGAPYPSGLDAPNGAAQIQALAEWADSGKVFYATDAADRNSRFSTVPVGALVSSGATGEIWQKSGTGNSWRVIYADTGWVTTGFLINGDAFDEGSYLKISRLNGWVELRGEVSYNSATPLVSNDDTTGTPGNMADTNMITVPPAYAPGGGAGYITVPWRSLFTGGNATLYTTGKLTIVDGHTSSKISNGDFVRFSCAYRQG